MDSQPLQKQSDRLKETYEIFSYFGVGWFSFNKIKTFLMKVKQSHKKHNKTAIFESKTKTTLDTCLNHFLRSKKLCGVGAERKPNCKRFRFLEKLETGSTLNKTISRKTKQ